MADEVARWAVYGECDNGIESVVELRADHSPFISATGELVAALDGLA